MCRHRLQNEWTLDRSFDAVTSPKNATNYKTSSCITKGQLISKQNYRAKKRTKRTQDTILTFSLARQICTASETESRSRLSQ